MSRKRNKQKAVALEVKALAALLKYIEGFPDTNTNAIPNIPTKYDEPDGRFVKK